MLPKARFISIVLAVALAVPSLRAASQRTFVSTVGLDSNPCTRSQPCRNFAAAIAQTLDHGEVYVLDSGGYGVVSITRPVVIQAEGVSAGITAMSGQIGIQVAITTFDSVVLRGLSLNSIASDVGIRFNSPGYLHVEKSTVTGFGSAGIEMTGTGYLFVDDSFIRDCSGNQGLWTHTTTTGGMAHVSIDNTRFEFDNVAVATDENVRATIRNSVASGNYSYGFSADTHTAGTDAQLTLESCVAANNHYGVVVGDYGGGTATLRLSNVTISGNDQGLFSHGGTFLSFGNNQVAGNTVDGTVSAPTIPRM